MARPTHHFYVHHKANKKNRKKQPKPLTAFDNFMIMASFVYPLSGLPQVFSVWHGGSVSVLTWTFFLCFGFFSLAYGIIHNVKPMIIQNIIWTFIDVAIVIGGLRN